MTVVAITGIASSGDGVGRLDDGRAVFVPRTAPGDRVELRDLALHKRFARARLARVIEPGPGRTEPRCIHYVRDQCGGCQLQHLGIEAQREAKRSMVQEALRRIGGREVEVPPVVPSPAEWGYRNRITLTVDPASGRAGFHSLGEADRVFPLERCEIAAEGINTAWAGVRDTRWPAVTERVTVRLNQVGGVEVLTHTRDEPPPFVQVQSALGDRIRREAVKALTPAQGDRAWDLYAGTGAGSDLLAQAGAVVEGVELHPDAVATAPEREGITRHVGDVGSWLPQLCDPDLVLVNPPRTGLGPGVAEAIVARRPRRVAYVSCDPATLARDLKAMPEYRITSITAWDLFPQTAHVETVVGLEREAA